MFVALLAGLTLFSQTGIPNGSFEQANGDRAIGWGPQTWAGRADFRIDEGGHSGTRCARIDSTAGVDGGWQSTFAVKPYSKYKITAWIKTEGVSNLDGQGALLNLHGRSERTEPITGSHDWAPVSMNVDTGADDSLILNCLLGYYGRSKGKAWFDDLQVQLLETRKIDPKVTIDATQKGEPISKYIYSQFIEHLGRCIYGGIWAEMLDDRKFYFAPGSKDSPWRVFRSGSVTMDTKEPFVGDHTPVVTGGIVQDGLWLQKGREYVGHVWLRGEGPVEIGLYTNQGSRAMDRAFAQAVTARATGQWIKTEFRFKATEDTTLAEFRISGKGPFRVGTVTLMPADNVDGMRKDTIALLKELNAPLYRWPGGNFASGYDWHDGIGDRDRRPPRKNPAWQGIEHNDFGTHEFLNFCRLVNTEPLIVVNTGFGDAHTATSWLQYVNGPASSEEGIRRTANGHKDPWKVSWWGIGNEMYGSWQLGHIPLDQYVIKHNLFMDRMTKIDPDIKTIASSDIGGDWSKTMLENCPMTLISEHFYCQERPGVAAHVAQIPNAIRAKVAAHRKLRDSIPGLKEKHIKIAMDEWNYWYGPHVFGELGTRYFLKDGLGIAAGLHEYYRSSDMVGMAQYAQTVNVIGCIKTNPIHAAFETTGLVLMLYRKEYGTIPLTVGGTPEPLDVAAALTSDGRFLTLSIVNPMGDSIRVPLTWNGIHIAASGHRWEIADADPMAHNDPEDPDRVQIKESSVSGLRGSVEVKPYSATLIRIAIER